jgi:hypothetical protein
MSYSRCHLIQVSGHWPVDKTAQFKWFNTIKLFRCYDLILQVQQLRRLIDFCRLQGLEPLVEVHTDQEMEIALDAGARVIGVNNRNLHTFELDLGTTERVAQVAQKRGIR